MTHGVTKPIRLRLSRAKGFNLRAASRAANGLDAVVVARPMRWGNPFRIGKDGATAAACVDLFRHEMGVRALSSWHQIQLGALRGKNLACWCAHGTPCHADVLLELANAPKAK